MTVRSVVRAGCLCALLTAAGAAAQVRDLAELSLEQLSDIVVTSVSRREEQLSRAAAPVAVVTADDLRRAGAMTLPEALRLVPQLNVARVDAHRYAISARGFNNVIANRMLVLVDGRTVYTPLFSGVFWEVQDVMLDDVERIEVITGPSTALWGTNAVNGLIHVHTKSAAETQGTAVSAHAGTEERGVAARHGWTFGERGRLRLYAKADERDSTRRADGVDLHDSGHRTQVGFRADWARDGDNVTVSGDAYRGSIDQPAPAPRDVSGAHLLARWERAVGEAALSLQGYVERTHRRHPQLFEERLATVDLVGQLEFKPLPRHHVVVGGGWRRAQDRVGNSATLAFLPAAKDMTWTRLFVQDQIAFGETLELALSASVERNPYTGTEWLPTARLAWRPSADSVWWASVARAVRAPSRIDREYFQPPPAAIFGGPGFRSEVSDVIQLGQRGQSGAALSYSWALFHHEHRHLRSLAPVPGGQVIANDVEGRTRGIEAWLQWQPHARWRLAAGGVALRQSLHAVPGRTDASNFTALGNDPSHWWSLRSGLAVAPRVGWDVTIRRVGALPNPAVPAYTAIDTRLAWRPHADVELALAVQNLLDRGHPEWGAAAARAELPRAATLQLRWRR